MRLVISRHSSAPSTTIKSAPECQELRVGLLVRSVRPAECTLAPGFSTVGFFPSGGGQIVWRGGKPSAADSVSELGKHPPGCAHVPATSSRAARLPEQSLASGRATLTAYPRPQHQGPGGSGWGGGLTSMFNRKGREGREERKRWRDLKTVLPLQDEG